MNSLLKATLLILICIASVTADGSTVHTNSSIDTKRYLVINLLHFVPFSVGRLYTGMTWLEILAVVDPLTYNEFNRAMNARIIRYILHGDIPTPAFYDSAVFSTYLHPLYAPKRGQLVLDSYLRTRNPIDTRYSGLNARVNFMFTAKVGLVAFTQGHPIEFYLTPHDFLDHMNEHLKGVTVNELGTLRDICAYFGGTLKVAHELVLGMYKISVICDFGNKQSQAERDRLNEAMKEFRDRMNSEAARSPVRTRYMNSNASVSPHFRKVMRNNVLISNKN